MTSKTKVAELSAEQLPWVDKRIYEAWGHTLTPEQFLQRQVGLRDDPWTRKHQRNWGLFDETGEILSSCESFEMPSYFRLTKGEISQGVSYLLASVFTPPTRRGRGYSRSLLTGVMNELAPSSPHAFVLYSEIGPELYEKSGFHPQPSYEWLFACEPSSLPTGFSFVTRQEIDELDFSPARVGAPDFFLQTGADQIRYQMTRQDLYARFLNGAIPEYCGVTTPSGSFAIWAVDYRDRDLWILFLNSQTLEETSALIDCARAQASALGLTKVRCWETRGPEWPVRNPGQRLPRSHDLAMIRFHHPLAEGRDWVAVHRALWA